MEGVDIDGFTVVVINKLVLSEQCRAPFQLKPVTGTYW